MGPGVAALAAGPASTAPHVSLESCRAPRGLHRPAPPLAPRVPRRCLAPCAFGGGLDSGSMGSSDGDEVSLSRELERRSGSYRSLAAHLDLLYQASTTVSSTGGKPSFGG